MAGSHALVVWAHPRVDSLTAQVTRDVIAELQAGGASVEELDLYRRPFDPLIWEADEPDWEDPRKTYSPEVMSLIEQAERATAMIFVFPVWWYALPAIMKGYIDRVWNHGVFYGEGRRIDARLVLWIGIAGETREKYRKRGYDEMIEHALNVAIAGYCGIEDSRVEFLYNTLGEGIEDMSAHVAGLREQANETARRVLTAKV